MKVKTVKKVACKLATKLTRVTPSQKLPLTLMLSLLASFLISACAVGPNFTSPASPIAADAEKEYKYTAYPIAQKTVTTTDITAKWWTVFQSKELDQLLRLALENNPTLLAAQSALRAAQENYQAQVGTLYPNVAANLNTTRTATPTAAVSGGGNGSLYTLYNASIAVSYTLDIFGGNRRAIESLKAAVDYERFQVEATYLTLTANLVTTAIAEASLRAQLAAQEDILLFQTKQQEVIEAKFKLGAIKKIDVLNQRTLVAQTRALLPQLKKSLEQTRHQLAVYAGKLPSDKSLPTFDLNHLHLPSDVPLMIPSELIRKRPDILASEALLHQASAQIGVATANLYPSFTLIGSYGSAALQAGQLFKSTSELWSVAGNLVQPIFNGGALNAKRRAAIALYDQAYANYQLTVLHAFENMANALQALDLDTKRLTAQTDVLSAAQETLKVATEQYQLGAIDSLTLLDAKRTYQTARSSLIEAQAARYADTAALFQALGGGWWNRSESEGITVTTQQ